MKVLIVEDEAMARKKLASALKELYPDTEIEGETGSVSETIAWLKEPGHEPDIIFMDVELSDGDCFGIFRQADIRANVIMTTAYDHYAVKAFEVESIDYLLKPIEPGSLKRAVERCMARMKAVRQGGAQGNVAADGGKTPKTAAAMAATAAIAEKNIRKRFLVRLNDTIVPIPVSEVAYFYSEDKTTYLVTRSGQKYVEDFSLDIAMEQLDPATFFRISRNCIISVSAISSITRIGSRFRIEPEPETGFDLIVSRSRADDFLHWLEDK